MQFAKPLLAAFGLGSMVALPAHAELDVASLKESIETSFEADYEAIMFARGTERKWDLLVINGAVGWTGIGCLACWAIVFSE